MTSRQIWLRQPMQQPNWWGGGRSAGTPSARCVLQTGRDRCAAVTGARPDRYAPVNCRLPARCWSPCDRHP